MGRKKGMKHNRVGVVEALAKELIQNPRLTQKELAELVGANQSTVSRAKDELALIKDERIDAITDDDYLIVRKVQKVTNEILDDPERFKNIATRDLVYIGEVSTRRYALFKGSATDAHGGLVAPQALNFYMTRNEVFEREALPETERKVLEIEGE